MLYMGISNKVSDWLKNLEHDAVHLNDLGLHMLPDVEIIKKASEESRIILTADMDFGQLLALTQLSSISVIQFRVTDFTPLNIISKLELLFDKFSGYLETGYILTVEDNRIRSRKLPI